MLVYIYIYIYIYIYVIIFVGKLYTLISGIFVELFRIQKLIISWFWIFVYIDLINHIN